MRQQHDPLVPQRRNKKTGETPDETEQRLDADLRALMNDKRYRKDDRDFRHYVQRQFRRVYDDPSGERAKGLRIGRPRAYVGDLEPFDRRREQVLRRAAETRESEGAKVKRTGADKPLPDDVRIRQVQSTTDDGSTTEDGHDIIPPEERAMGRSGPGDSNRAGPTPGVFGSGNEEAMQRYLDIAEARMLSNQFLKIAKRAGWDDAIRAHEHYREGSGDPLIIDAETVRDYEPVVRAQQVILGHLSDWFEGKRIDSRFGRPWLDLGNGEKLVIGDESFDPDRVAGLVRWETTFKGPSELEADFWTDARMTINSGTLESFSHVVLEQHGDLIEISGYVKLRIVDRYDFEEDHPLKSKVLEDYDGAKSFGISTTFWVRPISGWIDISGSPVPRVRLTFDD